MDPAHNTWTLPVREIAKVFVTIGRSDLNRKQGPTEFVVVCTSLCRGSLLPFDRAYIHARSQRFSTFEPVNGFRTQFTPVLFTRTSSCFYCAKKVSTLGFTPERSIKSMDKKSRRSELLVEVPLVLEMASIAFDCERPAM